jgi:cyclopropane fatty-acyl-phospholipid synthase-like methyltransferase
MSNDYFQIKDRCRKGLLKYLLKAFSLIPKTENPRILDIGCGSGVPTLWLAENLGGIITAIDIDKNSLDWLQKKILSKNLTSRIITLKISFFDFKSDPDYYDIILAEGFLNIVGFYQGFSKVIELLKKYGYLIIHDEYKDHEQKYSFILKNHCKLIDTIFLDENVWWDDYYKQVENEINAIKIEKTKELFKSDLKEIKLYKSDPASFRSMYYIVEKQ